MVFLKFFFFLLVTNFFRFALFFFCIECLAKSIEKKVKKFLSGKKYMGKVQGTDVSSRVEKVDASSGDHQEDAKKKKGKLVNQFFFVVVILALFGNVLVLYLQCVLVFFVGTGVMPLLSNVMVVEGAVEIDLKGVGKIVSVHDKSLTAGTAKIGSSMLGLDGIETMENVKQIYQKCKS